VYDLKKLAHTIFLYISYKTVTATYAVNDRV